MSAKKLDRLLIIEKVCKKEIKLNKAAKLPDISTRQAIRLKKAYQKEGPKGLISKKAGKSGNNRISQEKKEIVLKFFNHEDHRDFGPLLAHEYISKEDPDFMSVGSFRKVMIEYGLWKNRKTKKKKIYRLRARKARAGEMEQVDGSDHDRFEGRRPCCTLLVYIDDATNETFARFAKSENSWDYLNATRAYIEKYGRPHVLYSDKHSVFLFV